MADAVPAVPRMVLNASKGLMVRRFSTVLIACLSLLVAVGCGGGGGSGAPLRQGCNQQGGGETLCLVKCNLGCTQTGCAISDIYQNQQIVLTFNQALDPTSVTSSSVSLRTSGGEEPVGLLLTQDNSVTFVPEIRVVGGASFFGFTPQESYELRLPGGPDEINALRSVSGDRFAETLSCTLKVTRGILDLDGEPPRSKLTSPAKLSNVAPVTPIVLEFSEIIDNTPFVGGGSTGNEPIAVLVGRTRPAAGGGIECNPQQTPVQLKGAWSIDNNVVRQVSTATFTPSQKIPTSVCVAVRVTPGLTDLSGRPSEGEAHTYTTVVGTQPLVPFIENFVNDLQFDGGRSAGSWIGGAKPGLLGWDGLHGDFNFADGKSVGGSVFEWSTDNQLIPRTRTLSGNDEIVTDGVFRFTNFVLPAGQTVRFVGSKPAQIYVRGEVIVDGVVEANGESLPEPDGGNTIGQSGGAGGAFAGDGGKGADKGNGTNSTRFDGQDGEPVRVPASHAYAQNAANTGGKGSTHFPAQNTGPNCTPATCVEAGLRGFFTIQVAAGGGGGGFDTAGASGIALKTPNEFNVNQPQYLGPPAAGGDAFAVLPLPAGAKVFNHFLVGGSGGGGAGSHTYNSDVFNIEWRSGGGGGGGGGAIGFRAGRSFTVGAPGRLSATGGSTRASATNNFGTPGGGGSGGSIVIQAAQVPVQSGALDVRGGMGGSVNGGFTLMESEGGDGGSGYYRIEAPLDPPTSDPEAVQWAGLALPVPKVRNLAKLTETDPTTGVQSLFYETNQIFPPEFVRYEIDATVGGTRRIYSDDSSKGPLAGPGQPIEFLIQGAKEGPNGQVGPGTASNWRRYVGSQHAPAGEPALADDSAVGYRFAILFNNRISSTIHSVTIYLRI